MALQDPDSKSVLSPEAKTGFTYDGKEIVLSKTRGRPMNAGKGIYGLPDSKRIEVATLYAVTGNVKTVAELAGVSEGVVRDWRKQDWFIQLLEEIRNENNDKIDTKFTEIIHESLDLIQDRLRNGDSHVTKSGAIIKVPVKVKELAIVAAINVDKRQILRNKPTKIVQEAVPVMDKLDKLAEAFTALANKKEIIQPQVIEDVDFSEIPTPDGQEQETV